MEYTRHLLAACLANPAVQKRFNYDRPVWGKLYEGMVLPGGATVDAAFGARPLFKQAPSVSLSFR